MPENYLTYIKTENATHRGIALSNLLLPIGKMSMFFREFLLSLNFIFTNLCLGNESKLMQQYKNKMKKLFPSNKFSHRKDMDFYTWNTRISFMSRL